MQPDWAVTSLTMYSSSSNMAIGRGPSPVKTSISPGHAARELKMSQFNYGKKGDPREKAEIDICVVCKTFNGTSKNIQILQDTTR